MLSPFFALFLTFPFLLLRVTKNEGSFPRPLSAEDEQKYLALAAQGDVSARDILIEHNLRLVAHIIKKYYTQTSDQDDLISIGTIGLIKGISTYNPSKGVRLATYASRCIENEILMHFRTMKKSANDLSLSDSIDQDSEGGSLSLMDVISVEDNIFEELTNSEICTLLRRHIKTVLTERERKIISLRYGLSGSKPLTQREVSAMCGISRSYVSRIEKRALEKLRDELIKDDII